MPSEADRPVENPTVRGLRKILLVVLVLGIAGTLTELLLIEHTEGYWQPIPLFLLGAGLLGIALRFLRPGRSSLRILQGVLGLFVLAGFLGIFLHYKGNMEFELEMVPSRGGFDLFWETIRGATPALAPGAMIHLGLVGLAYCFRHPLTRGKGEE